MSDTRTQVSNHRLVRGALVVCASLLLTIGPGEAATSDCASSQHNRSTAMITQAITDEVLAHAEYQPKKWTGSRAHDGVFYSTSQSVLIEPFGDGDSTFTTHVLYPLAEFGWVMREVTVYPRENVAGFWFGYDSTGPGLNTGFNCTHSKSNCKLEDLDLDTIKDAFATWCTSTYAVTPATGIQRDLLEGAKTRNNKRQDLRVRAMTAD